MKRLWNKVDRTLRQECLVYIIIWALILLVPLINEYFLSHGGGIWPRVFRWWNGSLLFIALFLVHRIFIVPRFFNRDTTKKYILITLLAVGVFCLCRYVTIPQWHMPVPPPGKELHAPGFHEPPPKPGTMPLPTPTPWIPLMLSGGLAVLMLGFNLAIVMLFRNLRQEEERERLAKMHLEDELRYLHYQISPHFFMNMLNNIHALVEIDPPKAQKVIIGLSKLMRYSLYEADTSMVSLSDEINFVSNYVDVMRVRYPDDIVEIKLDVPEYVRPDYRIAPLLYMPLIENAFKHGVSYAKKTVIDISIRISDGMIGFYCSNTCPPQNQDIPSSGGIGLDNVRRRVGLLYGDSANMVIAASEESYSVTLIIPGL